MDVFNRDMLSLLRESRGLTQTELSTLLGVNQGTISKIENGTIEISEDIATKLPMILDYPKELFYEEKRVIRVEGHYRKKLSLSMKETKKYKAKMTLTEWHVNKLSDSIDLPTVNIPSWDLTIDGNIKDAARFVREYWKIPRGRIADIATVLEDNGILIAPLDLGEMDGLSTYSAEYNIPILYINKNRPADRIRMTLAHEACHYVCHFGKKINTNNEERDIEQEANEFASELLIPENEIRPQIGSLNLEKLGDLKRYWKVSMQAILYKAKKMKMLTDNQYQYLWKQISFHGYRKNEPFEPQADNISLLKELINVHINDLHYSKDEVAKLMKLNKDELEHIYFGASPKVKFHLMQNRA
jgi:Zn-dependent peptidase ImmA (M78 family)/transcriptional regulator with XRE-family HTH domain